MVNRKPIRLAIDALDAGPRDVVLDLGCGPGASVAMLSRRAALVHGIDASETMIATARYANRHAIAEGRVTLATNRFEKIVLPDNSVDRILAANVAYFWHDMSAVVAEIRRVVRPGGRLVLYLTDVETMRDWAFADNRTHRHFDADSLQCALMREGIERSQIAVKQHRLPGRVAGLICAVEF